MIYAIITYSVVHTHYLVRAGNIDAAKVELVWAIVFTTILGLKLLAS